MTAYVFGTSLSYHDYLQASNFEDSVRGEISESARSIIASNEELQREHITVSEAVSAAVTTGSEELTFEVQRLTDGISELNARFQWGFSELLMVAGRVNDTLDDLVRIAKTPAQTWAYEQFEIARDAFRQELYHEALEQVDRSISGYASNPGYVLEYRFHYLLGTIRLGGFGNNSEDVVDLVQAQSAFQKAARYARQDHPKEAARALLAAGWAAYCQGKLVDAERFTEQAVALNPELAEALFQLAKIQMHVDEPERALPSLRAAIQMDRGYSLKAATDEDFKRHETELHALLEALRHEAKELAEEVLEETRERLEQVEALRIGASTRRVEVASAKQFLSKASTAVRSGTYFGYLDSVQLIGKAALSLSSATAVFTLDAEAEVKRERATLDARISGPGEHGVRGGCLSYVAVYVGVGLVALVIQFLVPSIDLVPFRLPGVILAFGFWFYWNRIKARDAARTLVSRRVHEQQRLQQMASEIMAIYKGKDLLELGRAVELLDRLTQERDEVEREIWELREENERDT